MPERLRTSTDMDPVAGSVELEAPIEAVWDVFSRPRWWPRWNRCFWWVANERLAVGRPLVWVFQPIRPWMPYKLPAVAPVVEMVADDGPRRASWDVTAVPGMYARHTYFMEPLPGGGTRFGSWEQATGAGFRALARFWLAHFSFVLDESLAGARRLDDLYRRDGSFERLRNVLG